jgi:4,5-DOPA dioxygenase extradiol
LGKNMNEKSLSTVFVSHGAPTMPFEDIPARDFLIELGKGYGNIEAVLCISAHWETSKPTLNAVDVNDTIHDFYGFQPELYELNYPVKGSPELAEKACEMINNGGIECELDYSRGLDHGAWIPMMLMFPDAEIPVFQLSIQKNLDPMKHFALGKLIEPLRHEGVLILGSGGAVHPLGYAPLRPGATTDGWAVEFNEWLKNAVLSGNTNSLLDYRSIAPYPERAHPYPDHFMPLITSMGAAGDGVTGRIIHDSWYWGDLGMGAYEFRF